ncbi:MAG: acetyl-CoA carboxylase, carboxyltransferase subunit beta [bacterium]
MAVGSSNEKKGVPAGLWTKCEGCNEIIYKDELSKNLKVCSRCGYYFRLSARERIDMLIDNKSFKEYDRHMKAADPLGFKDSKKYDAKLIAAQKKSGLNEAVITGEGLLGGNRVVIASMDFGFLGGSMASVVGEKISRAVEHAIEGRMPVIIVSSSGGARMQEGILSLMQMAKTSAVLARLSKEGLAYISVLTNPTTGGVAASFAMLGDVIIAEPKALIGFAGPRVIEQTIRQKLPEGFQRSEFLLDHGMVDLIIDRKDIKSVINQLLSFFRPKK